MRYCWVISAIIFLVLGLSLGSRATPLAYAEQPQGAESTGVTQGVDERESEAVSQVQPRLDTPVVSMTRPPESARRSGSQRGAEAALTRVTTKLALDLGLIRQPEEDAGSALGRVGISPKGGWSRNAELTPEIFYDVLAAARRAANAGRLSVSADGAEAIVRAVVTPFFASLEEGATEDLPFVAAEDRSVVASEAPTPFYEQAPVWPYEWQSGFYSSPVVIVRRPVFSPLHRRHHVFVPCPAWQCRPRIASFGGPVVRSPAFTRTRISPPLRVVPMAPRSFSPPVFGFRGGTGAMHMSGGHFHGNFRR
jgi:hypothetical protein